MKIEKPDIQYEKPKILTYTEKDYLDLIGPVCLSASMSAIYFNKTLSAYSLESRSSALCPVDHHGRFFRPT
jgi:hypothetical protein